MGNNKQRVKGSKNFVLGANYGSIVYTDKHVSKTEIIYDDEIFIDTEQQYQIREKIKELADLLSLDSTKERNGFSKAYQMLYNKFKIPTYKALNKELFSDAMTFLQRQIATIGMKKLKRVSAEEWRKKRYTAIYARCKQIGIDKSELTNIINGTLNHKKSYCSLKELSDRSLEYVYKRIFSMRKK